MNMTITATDNPPFAIRNYSPDQLREALKRMC